MRIPSFLKGYIPPEAVKQFSELVNQPALVAGIRDAAQRLGWKESWQPKDLQDAMRQARNWVESFTHRNAAQSHSIQSSINATGEIFSRRWTSVPLDRQAIQLQAIASSSFTDASSMRAHLRAQLVELSGAESAVVVSSVAQAIRLVAQLPNLDDGWVMAKADCMRIEEGTDLRELLASSGRTVQEIGATNDCGRSDIEQAFRSQRQAILTASPSLLHDRAKEAESYLEIAIEIAKKHHATVVELHLIGHWFSCDALKLESPACIPVIAQRLKVGADIVIVPGNGLVGGPEAAIILGTSKRIQPLTDLAVRQGAQISLATSVTLSSVLAAALNYSDWCKTPVGAILSNSLENLQHRASRLAIQIEGTPGVKSIRIEECKIPIGDGIWNRIGLLSPVLRIEPDGLSAQELQAKLRWGPSSVMTKLDGSSLLLVLRTIDPDEDREVVAAFQFENKPAEESTVSKGEPTPAA